MPDPLAFDYDVFLSHSSDDKATVREVAERLRAGGLRVWFDEWSIPPGGNIPSLIEKGLAASRTLVLFMSEAAFGSAWATLESQTFRFRDPLNEELRFIPVRLDDAEVPGSLAQFLYLDWREDRDRAYARLLDACTAVETAAPPPSVRPSGAEVLVLGGHSSWVNGVAWSPDGRYVLSGSHNKRVWVWGGETGRLLRTLKGHTGVVLAVAWSPDGRYVLSGSGDRTVRIWEAETGRSVRTLEGHVYAVSSVAWSPDGRYVLSGSRDETVRMWETETGRSVRAFGGHTGAVSVAWSPDGRYVLSGSVDNTVRVWEAETGRSVRTLEGHAETVSSVAWSPDGRYVLSGSVDNTVRVWEAETGRSVRTLEGHTGAVFGVTWSPDGRYVLSGSRDETVRVWEAETGRLARTLEGHTDAVSSVAWSPDGRYVLSGSGDRTARVWNIGHISARDDSSEPSDEQAEYTNAKVLLVGESGAGKTGLSMRLASDTWEASDSTVGAWATQWKLPVPPEGGVEREIWLWDFGGQADQRLIHQLYMDETALAVLVYDGQKTDLFETLGTWDRDLGRAATHDAFQKLLAAGRVDAGGVRVSRERVEAFAEERGFVGVYETSAKTGAGCDDLKTAILDAIDWDRIGARTSPVLFKRLKDEIVRLKDAGRTLMRINELRETLAIRLTGEDTRFTDDELGTVLTLLSGPGVVWELGFGSWVLLRPELINVYAQAVIRTMREDRFERGCLPERRVLDGDLSFPETMPRLGADDERTVLHAMHKILLERGLCLREETDEGALLVFPSYYRRERPDLVDYPSVLVSYRFTGFLDDVYATLVVRLHHTVPFDQHRLWRYAADFETLGTQHKLGVRMTRRGEGAGEIEVYFDDAISIEQKIVFGKYVHEHLRRTARDVERFRHYVCPHCGTPVENRAVAMRKLDEGGADATIVCVNCEMRVPLWDEMEELFASDEMRERVRTLQGQAEMEMERESAERALVGDVISTVTLAGQDVRERPGAEVGVDMEITFATDEGEPVAQTLRLRLYPWGTLTRFSPTEPLAVDVAPGVAIEWGRLNPIPMVVWRESGGDVMWMPADNWRKQTGDDGEETRDHYFRRSGDRVRLAYFLTLVGERLDVMAVRRMRDRVLGNGWGSSGEAAAP